MIDFATSPQSTLGVEWEIALIDRESGALTQRASEVLSILRERRPELLEPASNRAHVTGEFLENTVEVVTGICRTVAEACRQLQDLTDTLRDITDELGIEFYPAGTHPFSHWLTSRLWRRNATSAWSSAPSIGAATWSFTACTCTWVLTPAIRFCRLLTR